MSFLFARRRCIQRWLFFGTVACAGLTATLWTGYAYWAWNRVGQIPDIGDPFDVEAWLPPNLSDDENAAVVYRKAFLLLDDAKAPLPDGTPIWDSYRTPPVADEEVFLQVTATLCQLLQQAASMPEAIFSRPEDMRIEDNGIFPDDWNFVREICRLVQARAEILRSRGNFEEAMSNLMSVVALARHFAAKGNFFQQLVAKAIESVTLTNIRECACESSIKNDVVMQALTELRQLRTPAGAPDGFKAEYLYSMKCFSNPAVVERHLQQTEEDYRKSGITRDGVPLGPLSRPLPLIGCTSQIELERTKRLLKLATANLLAASELPYYERPPVIEEAVKVQSAGISVHSEETIELFSLDGMSGAGQALNAPSAQQICSWIATTPWLVNDRARRPDVFGSFDRIAAKRGLTLTFLALRAWQIRTGGYPTTLKQLVGIELDDLPLDPFSGRPFGYVRSTGQFFKHASASGTEVQTRVGDRLLYSVGQDGVDQGATIECEFGSGQGDWVFALP